MLEKIKFSRLRLLESIGYMLQLLNSMEIKRSRDFSYFLNRNTKMLRNHFESAVSIHEGTRSQEYEEFQQGIRNIHVKWAAKKEDGEIIKSTNGWPICGNAKARDEEVRGWNAKHKEMITAYETQLNEAMEILHVEEEYEVFPIELDKVPENVDIAPMDMFIKENLDLYKIPEKTEKKEEKQAGEQASSEPESGKGG